MRSIGASFMYRSIPLLVLVSLLPCAVHAQVTVHGSAFVANKYIWRGQALSQGPVLQPTLEAATGLWRLAFFGNVDSRSAAADNNIHFNEADLSLIYHVPLANASVQLGYTLYTFPTPTPSHVALQPTQEIFAALAFELPFENSLWVSYDFDGSKAEGDIKGLYAEVQTGLSIILYNKPLHLSASLGFDHAYLEPTTQTTLSHIAFAADQTWTVGQLSFTPTLGFQYSLSSTYAAFSGRSFLYGGLTITP